MIKNICLVLGTFTLIVFIIYGLDIPIMQNPAPDYHSVQNRPGINSYEKRVSIRRWMRGRGLDY